MSPMTTSYYLVTNRWTGALVGAFLHDLKGLAAARLMARACPSRVLSEYPVKEKETP